jgi:hypothetical protein
MHVRIQLSLEWHQASVVPFLDSLHENKRERQQLLLLPLCSLHVTYRLTDLQYELPDPRSFNFNKLPVA